jgi:long-chain acyl-CoA synthetase
MIETESGITVQPELIENALTFSPYVKRAVAVGKGRPSIGALIQIDRESVGSWAQRKGIPYTTFRDLTTKPEVIGLIGQEVEKVNQDLDRTNCVTHYTLLEKELESEDQELTRIGRPRRSLIENKYKNLIDSMYMGRKGFEQ